MYHWATIQLNPSDRDPGVYDSSHPARCFIPTRPFILIFYHQSWSHFAPISMPYHTHPPCSHSQIPSIATFIPLDTSHSQTYSSSSLLTFMLTLPLFTPISYHLFSLYPFIPISSLFIHHTPSRPCSSFLYLLSCMQFMRTFFMTHPCP